MDDATLKQHMADAGVDDATFGAIELVPLFHVAWADGHLQAAEIDKLRTIARDRLGLGPAALALVERWVTEPSPPERLQAATRVLVEIARRQGRGPGGFVASSVGELIARCAEIADAAGGFLGLGARSPTEKQALAEIADLLHVDDTVPWNELMAQLDGATA